MPTLALVAEGEFDLFAYAEFIARENNRNAGVHARQCRGCVSGRFLRILTPFKYPPPRIERAVVVSDAHGRDPDQWRTELQRQSQNADFPFSIEHVVVVNELEAILLCDPTAIASLCAERGRAIAVPQLTRSPESYIDAKQQLETILARGGVPYTRAVARELAARADLERLAYWSQSYRSFQAAVRF